MSSLTAGVALVLAAGTAAGATEDVPHSLTEVIDAALDAWSEFATTGDLAVLSSSFVSDGPQWRQFHGESAAWEPPAEGEPLRFEVRELRLRNLDTTTATVWVEVEASRVGSMSEVFTWDFDLIHDSGRWQVWTVIAADKPPTPVQAPATPTFSTLAEATTAKVAPATSLAASRAEPVAGGGLVAATADAPAPGTRLPALAAWIVVVTVVGVAVAGYMAPRIDRRHEG